MHGEYNKCPSCRGALDGYAGYLKDLKDYLDPLPTIVSEFGVPSSIASSHSGPGGRAQGGHSEEEMGMIIKDMLHVIYEEGYAGAFLFILYDEWYKKAWNTEWLQDPNMRPYWLNPLTSEQFYGVVGVLPGNDKETSIWIDGLKSDWTARDKVKPIYKDETMTMNTYVTHDEGYVYIMLENNAGFWSFPNETIFIGFDVSNQGGVLQTNQSGTLEFWGLSGVESVLKLNSFYGSYLYQNPFFDPLYYQYGDLFKRPTNQNEFASYILMMQLAVNISACGYQKPIEYYDAGYFFYGNQTANSMSYWYTKGNVLEIRIPWMLLGFTFPGTYQIHNYFAGPNGVDDFNYKVVTDALRLQVFHVRIDGKNSL